MEENPRMTESVLIEKQENFVINAAPQESRYGQRNFQLLSVIHANKSGRGLPQSKTWRRQEAPAKTRQRHGVRQSSAAFRSCSAGRINQGLRRRDFLTSSPIR